MTNTKVLLLDEPFANLDAITRKQLQIWLKDIAHKLNLSIILVTHDIESTGAFHRIIVMKGSPGSFVQSYDISQAHKSGTPIPCKACTRNYLQPWTWRWCRIQPGI